MDNYMKLMVGGVALVIGIMFGGIFYSEHLEHQVKMECVKAKGEYIGKSCVFRQQ